MPYTTSDTGMNADGKKQLGAELDRLVESGQISAKDAEVLAQDRGLTTGPGDNAYQAPGQAAADAAALDRDSLASAKQSAAYQQSRAGNPEGYTAESQAEFNAAHPLSEFYDKP